jgi:hypothetical protein
MIARREEAQARPLRARDVYGAAIGVLLGVALIVSLTDDLGRRVCGGVAEVPGAALLLGCEP